MNTPDNPTAHQSFTQGEFVDDIERDIPFTIVMTSKDPIHGEAVLQTAQAHITRKYLEEQFITPEDLDSDGVYRDEYTSRSVYLLAESSHRESASRYITATKKEGLFSLPTAKHFAVDPVVLRETAGVKQLSDIKPEEVIEISGLVSTRHGSPREEMAHQLDATRLMHARILRDSLDQGHKLWLFNTHETYVKYLRNTLGKDQVQRLGEPLYYKGSDTVPAALNPQKTVEAILSDTSPKGLENSEYLREALRDVSDRYLSKRLRELLDEHEIVYQKSTAFERVRRRVITGRNIGRAAVFTWVLARAAPIATQEPVPGLFFGLDIVTAFPYTWGLVEMVSGKTPNRRLAGGAVAATSFAIPYAYLYGFGEDYPTWFAPAIGLFVGTAGLAATLGIVKERRLEKRMRAVVPEKAVDSSSTPSTHK